MPQESLVLVPAGAEARDVLFGHDEQVRRRLRADILESDRLFVLVDDLGGDLARDYLTEDAVCHEYRKAMNYSGFSRRSQGPRIWARRASPSAAATLTRHKPA